MRLRSLLLVLALLIPTPVLAQTDRAVALVVSVGEGVARADAIQAQLQVIGAETLRAANPGNAELRAILKRFADEAANARATFVFLDVPAVTFEGREFVLPAEIYLEQPTDLFTQGIPLLAFARAAAQAEQGGAVALTVAAEPSGLPEGLAPLVKAPEAVAGSSPILVAAYGQADPVVQTMSSVVRDEVVEIGAILRRMQTGDGITISALPAFPAYLRSPPISEEAPEQDALASGAAPEEASEPETEEELALLEQSLSRSAKRSLQRSLRDLGHYKGLVDGIFGPQTRAAIIAFQTSRDEPPSGFLTRRQLLDLRAP